VIVFSRPNTGCTPARPVQTPPDYNQRTMDRWTFLAAAGVALAARQRGRRSAIGDYARYLPDYLSSLAATARERLNKRLAALKTPADIRSYRMWPRATFTRLLGAVPGTHH